MHEKLFNFFSVFSFGSHIVPWHGTVRPNLKRDRVKKCSCESISKSMQQFMNRSCLKFLLFSALMAILCSVVETSEQLQLEPFFLNILKPMQWFTYRSCFKISLFQIWWLFFAEEQTVFSNFGRQSKKECFCKNTLKSVL